MLCSYLVSDTWSLPSLSRSTYQQKNSNPNPNPVRNPVRLLQNARVSANQKSSPIRCQNLHQIRDLPRICPIFWRKYVRRFIVQPSCDIITCTKARLITLGNYQFVDFPEREFPRSARNRPFFKGKRGEINSSCRTRTNSN